MLKRIYANNYRCLVNFELNLDRLTLLMGPNGGGKSALFDLVYGIRRLIVDKASIAEVFPPADLPAGQG
jgi:predicted ATPase